MEAKKAKTSEFHVDLGDVQLSAAAAQRLEAKIQEAVMSELAGYTPNPDDDDRPKPWWPKGTPGVFVFPREWLGIYLRRNKDVFDLPGFKGDFDRVNKRFGQ
ncbi:hypothetical protein [Persicitalea sp.]|uniref:hypothetical protein n=1 Tax=Persicitalea sp. TaxID=3100273 RepID=UPI0035934465